MPNEGTLENDNGDGSKKDRNNNGAKIGTTRDNDALSFRNKENHCA